MEKTEKAVPSGTQTAHTIYVAMVELEAARQSFERARRRVMLKKKQLQTLQFQANYQGKEAIA
jgi:hypothetical protein